MAEKRSQDLESGTAPSTTFAVDSSDQKNVKKKRRNTIIAIGLAGLCIAGVAIGLGVGLTTKGDGNAKVDKKSDLGDSPSTPMAISRLSAYDTSMMDGYDECDEFLTDLEQATKVMANLYIDRMALQYYHETYFYGTPRGGWGGGGIVMTADMAPQAEGGVASTTTEKSGGGGEDSFGSNNQVDGVDEADAVKSDGTYVYAAYSDTLVVLEAESGKEVSRTVIPTDDEDGVPLCDITVSVTDKKTTEEAPCYLHYDWQKMQIVSLLLHKDRITVIVQSPQYMLNTASSGDTSDTSSSGSKRMAHSSGSSPVLYGQKATRVFVYDTSAVGGSAGADALTLIKRKDIHGYYQSARSIEEHAHIVTSSEVNMWDSVYRDLDPPSFIDENNNDRRRKLDYFYPGGMLFDKEKLTENQYRNAARAKAEASIPAFVENLALASLGTSSPEASQCRNIVRLALYAKQYQDDTATDTDGVNTTMTAAPFTTSNVLSNFAQVTSFNILGDGDFTTTTGSTTTTATARRLSASSSGIFVPMNSYSKSVYSSRDKLILAGEAYEEDKDGNWEEKTLFFSFGLDQATSTPESVGQVPGSLLNQFSMDHFTSSDGKQDYLRVATTSWARWGVSGDDDVWTQTEESSSQVTVLSLPDVAGDGSSSSKMEVVGRATDLGKGERIYAVRFMDDKAFVVTFRQIDPFYTINMSDPTNPVVTGELKIPGFSNYLHPIGDGNTILAVGQDADEKTGRTLGLMIALYDVSDMSNPTQVKKFTESDNDGYSSSNAQYNHQAFRYLPETEVLILPVRRYSGNYEEDFDGFVVYDIAPTNPTVKIGKRFEISHKSDVSQDYCWSYKRLAARSLVFDGDVMTMKGHTVLSHALDDENDRQWMINLDSFDQDSDSKGRCYGWGY